MLYQPAKWSTKDKVGVPKNIPLMAGDSELCDLEYV